jgi:hypothetical protein
MLFSNKTGGRKLGFSSLQKNPAIGNCALWNTKSLEGSKGCEMRKLVLAGLP